MVCYRCGISSERIRCPPAQSTVAVVEMTFSSGENDRYAFKRASIDLLSVLSVFWSVLHSVCWVHKRGGPLSRISLTPLSRTSVETPIPFVPTVDDLSLDKLDSLF
jgi:hypothetical protein